MKKEKQQEKQTKIPIFVHPVQAAMYVAKQKSLEHSFNKMRKEALKIEQNRKNIADCAEKMSGGQVNAEKTMANFNKLDIIYSKRSAEAKPLFDELAAKQKAFAKDKTLTEEQKQVTLKPITSKIAKIYARYGVEAMEETDAPSVKLYDSQSRVLANKSGGISVKGAAVVALALAAVGVGVGYAYMSGMFGGIGSGDGKTEMEFDDYAGSTVGVFNLKMDANASYLGGIDSSDPKFVAMINSKDYQDAVVEIMTNKQAEAISLQEKINNQILAEYKAIDQLNAASGYNENNYGIEIDLGNFERVMDTNNQPLESWPAFLTRYKNYLESQNVEQHYQNANNQFKSELPQSVIDVYNKHNIPIDYEDNKNIVSYLSSNVTTARVRDPITDQWVTEVTFGNNTPEGTTMEFLKDYYEILPSARDGIYSAEYNTSKSQEYQKYLSIKGNIEHNNESFDLYYGRINSNYAHQIQEHINNIDNLQQQYITDSQQIQDSANAQMANLQQSSINMSSTNSLQTLGDQVYTMDIPQTGQKTGIIQNFVDSAVDALNDAQDAIISTIDDLTRSL